MKRIQTKPLANLQELEDQAVALLDRGKLKRAERILLKLLEDDRHSLPAHFYLARVYRRTKQFDLALHHARQTLKLSPSELNAYLALGMIYEEMGHDSLAATCYRKELANNPTSPESLNYLGKLYFKKRQWKKASKCLRRSLELGFHDELEDTVHKLGSSFYRLRDIRSYIKVYTLYLEMKPSSAWAAKNLGGALLHAGEYKRAVLVLTKANRLEQAPEVAAKLEQARKRFRDQK